MLSRADLKKRHFSILLEGAQFLTSRTSLATVGSAQYCYMGVAYPGSAETEPAWMIQLAIIEADGSTSTLFADGQALFNQIWADRVSLIYS